MPRAVTALLALMLAGCASPGGGVPAFPLLPPSSYGGSLHAQQIVTLAHGGGETALQCQLTIAPEQMSLRGYSAFGQRLFNVVYDGQEVKVEQEPLAGEPIPAEQIVGDLQFALWPLAALQDAAAGTRWSVNESQAGVRRLRHEGRLIAEARGARIQGRHWLVNLLQDYTLDIVDTEAAP